MCSIILGGVTVTHEPPVHAPGVDGRGFASGELALLRLLIDQVVDDDVSRVPSGSAGRST